MIYRLGFEKEALEHLGALKSGDKNAYIKCFDLILAILENPKTGIGKPERLKGYLNAEVYSRRISDKHSIVYSIDDENATIEIIACGGHYKDK